MTEPLPEYKRRALERQRDALLEEHEAANQQLPQMLSAADQTKIKRQIADLEEKIQEIERQLGRDPAQTDRTVGPAAPAETTTLPTASSAAEHKPEQLQDDQPPLHKRLWFTYLAIILPTLLVGFVSDIGGLLGLGRCTQLWVFSALSGLVGFGVVIYWSLPQHRGTYPKQDRTLTSLFALLVTVLFVVLALFCNRNRCPAISLLVTPELLAPGETAQLTARAVDSDGDPLIYYWEASHVGLKESGGPYRSPQNSFTASADLWGQTVTFSVKVDDRKCYPWPVARAQIEVVRAITPTPTATPTATLAPSLTPTATPKSTNTPTATPTPAPLAITNLRNGDRVAHRTLVMGEYPADLKEVIRVFVAPRLQADAEPTTLYPQSPNPCKGNDGAMMRDGRWEQQILLGLPQSGDEGLRFDVVLTTATAEGNAAVRAEMDQWCKDKWKGFTALPAGVSEVMRITVIRSGELLRAPDPSGTRLPGAINIAHPRPGQAIADAEVIRGAYDKLPAGHTVWVLAYTTEGRWFPQSSDACNGVHTIARNGQWQVTGNFHGGKANEPFDIVAVVADPAAGAFLDQTQREWCAQALATPDFKSPGLLSIELPQGISEKNRAQVVYTPSVVPRCAISVPCEGCKTFAYARSDACPLVDLQGGAAACTDEFLVQQSMTASSIRIDMLQRSEGNYGYSLYEVEAYADGAAANILPNSGSTAEASSAITPASRAIDGMMPDLPDGGGSSRWESEWQKDPQWFVIALSDAIKTRPINRIVLKWERAYARDYCVTLIP